MSLKRKRKPSAGKTAVAAASHTTFIPLIIVMCLIWYVYRSVFTFPVWFDESIGKALFFGLPVWLYVNLTGDRRIPDTFDVSKIRQGLLAGIAIGGLYGFTAAIVTALQSGVQVQPLLLFNASDFWWEFLLALLTSFWETLFFFSWIMVIWQEKFKQQSLLFQVLAVAGIFMIFHLPNAFLRLPPLVAVRLSILFFLFASGQALVFSRWRNGYMLVLSQAIWGMVLLVHLS